jgi:hypothetical protein
MELTTHQHQVLASHPIEVIIPWEEIANIMADHLKLHEHEKITSVIATQNGLQIEVNRPGKYCKRALNRKKMFLASWLEV